MNYRLKTIILLIVFTCVNTSFCISQTLEEQINNLIEKNDYLSLLNLKPSFNKLQPPLIPAMADVLLEIALNHPEAAVNATVSLLEKHQHELGEEIFNFLLLLSEQLSLTGNNKDALGIIEMLLASVDPLQTPGEIKESFQSLANRYRGLSQKPPLQIKNLQQQITIPFCTTLPGYVSIPGKIGEKEICYIMDTGAGFSVLSSKLAKQLSIEIIADSILLSGFGDVYARMGFAEKIYMGDIEIENMPFYILENILPKHITQQTGYSIDALIGIDLLRFTESVRFDLKKKEITCMPAGPAIGEKPNMMIWNSGLYTEIHTPAGRMLTLLDTGDNTSGIIKKNFYDHHQSAFKDLKLSRDTNNYAGVGGTQSNVEVYTIENFPVTIGNLLLPISGINISVNDTDLANHAHPTADATLGINAFQNSSGFTLDFKNMIFTIEN